MLHWLVGPRALSPDFAWDCCLQVICTSIPQQMIDAADTQYLYAYRDAAAADMGPASADDQLDPDAEWQSRLRQEMGVEDGFDEDLSYQYARCMWGICCLCWHADKPPHLSAEWLLFASRSDGGACAGCCGDLLVLCSSGGFFGHPDPSEDEDAYAARIWRVSKCLCCFCWWANSRSVAVPVGQRVISTGPSHKVT